MPPPPEQDVNALALKQGMPTNIEAEMFVLGSVLLDGGIFPQVAGALEEDDFATEKHKRIFASMRELQNRGEAIEYLTLGNELKKFQHLDAVGGIAYIASLTEGMPRLENIESYIKIVKNKSVLRRLIQASQETIANCIQEGREVDDILADAESSVMRVGNELLRSGLQSPRETIETFEGGLEAFLDPSKRVKGLGGPFYKFDEMTNGLLPGQLVVLAARPAMGKTAMALNIGAHVALPRGDYAPGTVAIFSLEMSREALLTRVLCTKANVNQHRFRGGYLNREERGQLSAALNELVQSKLFIDDTPDSNVMEIGAKCRRLQAEHGLDLVIVDYLQLLGSKGRVENRVQEISAFSRGLKMLAKDLNVPVLALSQLSRKPEERTGDHRPLLSDLRESGSIEQDADIVCFIFREEVYKPDRKQLEGMAELIIAKQRNGPTGRIKLAFLKNLAKFDNLAEDLQDESGAPSGPAEGGGEDEPPPF